VGNPVMENFINLIGSYSEPGMQHPKMMTACQNSDDGAIETADEVALLPVGLSQSLASTDL